MISPGSVDDCWVETRHTGVITDASVFAARMLHLHRRSLLGRDLFIFIGEDREGLRAALRKSLTVERELVVRPRDRRSLRARVVIAGEANPSGSLFWTFYPRTPEAPASAGEV